MTPARGCVYLVGAGPGDPELITVRGLGLLRTADVVVYDRLIAPELIREAHPSAETLDVGKAPAKHRYSQAWISALLVDRARRGKSVLRLKGGDPFIFGRGAEELAVCREAGVPCFVIPGVSSALAAPAAAGIALTRRGRERSFAVFTGQCGNGHPLPDVDFSAMASIDTLVILMGRANLRRLTAALVAGGRAPHTPAVCIERATHPDQRQVFGTLCELPDRVDEMGLRAPVVTVVGQVADTDDVRECLNLWIPTNPIDSVTQVG